MSASAALELKDRAGEEQLQELKDMNREQDKRLQQLEMRADQDPTEQLRDMNDTDMIDECVSVAVAVALGDGAKVIHAMHYTFRGIASGDLDGMVVGTWAGHDVVVLVEAKHNMNTCWSQAKKALFQANEYWHRLCALDPDIEDDTDVLYDYAKLRVADYKHRTVMFALGGYMFSRYLPSTKPPLQTPWFHVASNPNGMFTATLWCPAHTDRS
jgi:hypothetical protein